MQNKLQVRNIILLIIEIVVPLASLVALSITFYDTFQSLFIAKTSTILSSNGFTPLTNRINLLTSIVFLFSIPFTIVKLKNPDYKIPTALCVLKFVCIISMVYLLIIVFGSFIPAILISGYDLDRLIRDFFGDKQSITHLVSPILCVVYFILDKEGMKFKKRYSFLAIIPLLVYVIEYSIMVFGVQTWEDIYRMKQAIEKFTLVGFIFLLIGLIAIFIGIAVLLHFTHNKKSKKNNLSS